MWISSFVVTLPEAEDAARSVHEALASLPGFTAGERQGSRLPVVLEAPDGETARYWHEWVENLPGVRQVAVAFVSFEDSSGLSEDSTINSRETLFPAGGLVPHMEP